MWYKPYGQTGKDISVVSLGGMRFDNPEDLDTNAEVVIHAHSRGINYFDTAPAYCTGKSEDIFGTAFKHMKRDEFYVSTKSVKDSGDDLRADLECSLEKMGLDRIDFYHIWYIMSAEAWQRRVSGGAVAAALKAKEEGLIGHLAVSSHLRGGDMVEVLSEDVLEGVTLGYCAINFPYREEAVNAAGRLGLGVVTMNPLGGGLIPHHAERFDFLRSDDDPSVVTAAIRFNVSNPAITSALVGYTTKKHVDEAVDAVADFKPYDASHVDAMRKRIIGEMNNLCTGCGYCLPCPEGIQVPRMMDSYNYRALGESDRAMLQQMKWHWGISPKDAEACTQCGLCEERCTQHLPIRERLKELTELEDNL